MSYSAQDTSWGAAGQGLLEIGKILALQKQADDARKGKILDELRAGASKRGFDIHTTSDAELRDILNQRPQTSIMQPVNAISLGGGESVHLPAPAKLAGVPSVNLPDTNRVSPDVPAIAPPSAMPQLPFSQTEVGTIPENSPQLQALRGPPPVMLPREMIAGIKPALVPSLAASTGLATPQVPTETVTHGDPSIYQEAQQMALADKITLDPNDPAYGLPVELPSGRATYTPTASDLTNWQRMQTARETANAATGRQAVRLDNTNTQNALNRGAAQSRLEFSTEAAAKLAEMGMTPEIDDLGHIHLVPTKVAPGITSVPAVDVTGATGKTNTTAGTLAQGTDVQTKHAAYGGNMLRDQKILHEVYAGPNGKAAYEEAVNAFTRPAWARILPGIGSSVQDITSWGKAEGLSEPAQRALAAIWDFTVNAAPDQFTPGTMRSPQMLQSILQDFGGMPGQGEAGWKSRDTNRKGKILASKLMAKNAWGPALKMLGVTETPDLIGMGDMLPADVTAAPTDYAP